MFRLLVATVLLSALGMGPALHAQSYPNRTIKLVVPFPAGGATDNAARLVGRRLSVAGAERLAGKGVSHCASCDGPLLAGQEVCVVGGGDSALDEALVLAICASRVTLLCRAKNIAAQRALLDRANACEQIEIVSEAVVEEILGEEAVSAIRWREIATGVVHTKKVAGVFVYIGLEPNTAFLRDVVALDAASHIEADAMMRTSLPGVFAAGDIRKDSIAQLAAAAGDGATAAISAFRYLRDELARGGQ
jgi:thioredoxin reductase (NADPH)